MLIGEEGLQDGLHVGRAVAEGQRSIANQVVDGDGCEEEVPGREVDANRVLGTGLVPPLITGGGSVHGVNKPIQLGELRHGGGVFEMCLALTPFK